MRRALRNLLYALVVVVIGISLGLGTSIVYADYPYSPYGDLTYLGVELPLAYGMLSPAEERNAEERVHNALADVAQWADSHDVTVLYAAGGGGLVVNFGAFIGSDLLERELGIEGFGEKDTGAYVRSDPTLMNTYVEDTTVFPGVLDLPLLGTFETTSSIPVLNSADFIYPLALATNSSGLLYTDAKDTEELVTLLEARGFEINVYSRPFWDSLAELPKKLVAGNALTKALIVTIAALVFCLGYVFVRFYRDHERELWIRHCLGFSKRSMALAMASATAALVLAQIALFLALLVFERSYMGGSDLIRLSAFVSIMLFVFSEVANGAGLLWVMHRFRVRGGIEMRSARLALRDLANELGWIVLYGVVVSVVVYALILSVFAFLPASSESASIRRFEDARAQVVSLGSFPFRPESLEGELPFSRFDFDIPNELRDSLGELLSQGRAGTFVTLWGTPRGLGIPAEQTVVFLGAYADLTRFERDPSLPCSIAMSRDLGDYAGKQVEVCGIEIELGVIPEDMDIFHPLYYHRSEEVSASWPKTVFVFVPDYAFACEMLPGLSDANLLDRFLLFNPSEEEVADLRSEILEQKGVLVGVRSVEQQMGILEQAGYRAHASYLTFFYVAAVVLAVAMAMSLYRSLLRKIPEYAIHHVFGATIAAIRTRMALFALGYQAIPAIAAVVLLSLLGIMTVPVAGALALCFGGLVAGVVLLAQRRVSDAVSSGLRMG